MFVREIHEDDWQGVFSNDSEVPCERLEQVVNGLRKLNGDNKTTVVLSRDEDNYLIAGGGNDGFYICNVCLAGSMAYLIDPNQGAGNIALVAGGQEGDYPRSYAVTLDDLLLAAETFATKGVLNETLTWEPQG